MGYMRNSFLEPHSPTLDTETRERNKYCLIILSNRWTYRIYPTAVHQPFKPIENQFQKWISDFNNSKDSRIHKRPPQFRWKAIDFPKED